MSQELDLIKERASESNSLHGCSSDPCGSVVCQTARDRDELLSRLERAEQADQRVREMHRIDEYNECSHCVNGHDEGILYPCDTIRALDGETCG